ncbi:MAG TPA: nickel pincer cofactor biosynthesis protein LarC [Planctomycetota bacterium]|nr:nickel pincer cofactor biosynthesis protein LarC [Planctomycetota bacterium]
MAPRFFFERRAYDKSACRFPFHVYRCCAITPPKRILYLDPFAGIAGDMFAGALLDLGVDLARLSHEISKLNLAGYHLGSRRVFRGAMSAIKFDVEIGGAIQKEFDAINEAAFQPPLSASHAHDDEHGHEYGAHEHSHASNPADANVPLHHVRRTFREIRALIENSALSSRVKADSIAAFQKLAEAEGRIHAMPPDDVAFHEVGALDSIIDFVAVCAGLDMLGIDEVWCGPLALGSGGFVRCDHGLMPVPAPATLELVKGMPLRETPVEKELTTPTGAALVAALAKKFCATPPMRVEKIGYGAGSREKQAVPNVLRVLLGTEDMGAISTAQSQHLSAGNAGASETHAAEVVEMRANIDDATPEVLGYMSELLLAAGALDVFATPIQMKKNRPGVMVTALCEPKLLDALTAIFFRESTTFGVRYETLKRFTLQRETLDVSTHFGKVRVKIGRRNGKVLSLHPEYEDCRALAEHSKTALREVIDAARNAASTALNPPSQ